MARPRSRPTSSIKALSARADGSGLLFEAERVALHEIDTREPFVSFCKDRRARRVECDVIVGCDGFHGASRKAIPDCVRQDYQRTYPFAWLGILADVPPCDHELIYSNHANGFALASMRSPTRSSYYVQVPADTDLWDWPDERI